MLYICLTIWKKKSLIALLFEPSPPASLLYPKIMACLTEMRSMNEEYTKQVLKIQDIQPDVSPLLLEIISKDSWAFTEQMRLAISRRADLHLRTEIQSKPARTTTVPTDNELLNCLQHTGIWKLYFYNCATKCICVPAIFFSGSFHKRTISMVHNQM